MPEFIFQMQDLRKVVPPKREILKGIWLSFFYGAKIGVLGHNGAGKSSLLRIMAGQDTDFAGQADHGVRDGISFAVEAGEIHRLRLVLREVQQADVALLAVVFRLAKFRAARRALG